MHGYVRRLAATGTGLLLAMTVVGLPGGAAEGAATCKGRTITIDGSEEDDEITGTPGDDVIRAYGGDDVIDGSGGDDVICGDSGADELIGGPGDDLLHGGSYKLYSDDGENAAEGDLLQGGSGNDRMYGGGTASSEAVNVSPANLTPDRVEFPEARGGITVTADGVVARPGVGRDRVVDIQHLIGTEWADDLTVDGEEIVSGGDGDDDIAVVAGGTDSRLYPTLYGDAGDDRLDLSRTASPGYWLYGGEGDDTVIGSEYDDFIGDADGTGAVLADGGDDQIDVTSRMSVSGDGGGDTMQVALLPGPRESIDGGLGDDHVDLQNGTATPLTIDVPGRSVRADGSTSSLAGVESFGTSAREADVRFIGGEADEFFGVETWRGHTARASMGAGDDYFAAYATADSDDNGTATAWGGPGDDAFDGAESGDTLYGEAGNDRMFGDSGDDVLRGGPGDDHAYATRGESDSCVAEDARDCELGETS